VTIHNDPDLHHALATLVADEPGLPSGADDIERRGRRRRDRRRLAVAAGAAGVLAVGLGGAWLVSAGPAATPPPVAIAPPAEAAPTGDPGVDPGGTGLAQGFPLGSAIDAVTGAGVAVGEIPMDLGWEPDGGLTLPLADGTALRVTVGPAGCTASAPGWGAARSATVADAVCAAWVDAGSPAIVPAGPPGAERPDLAAQ
jgi:hypothetical protein